MSQQILSHFHKEEQPFVEKVTDWVQRVVNSHQPYLSDFVNPRQLEIIKSIVNPSKDLAMFFDGGYESAERVRVIIVPNYWTYSEKDFGLSFLKVNGKNKFESLEHMDYLGALLNLGVKRDKFGDILILGNITQYIVASEITDYVKAELKKIKNTNIYLEQIDGNELVIPTQNLQIISLTASSFRVDTIISQLYKQTRANVSQLIKSNKLQVNWRLVDKSDYILKVGDVVSLRGFGRFKLLEEDGNTKKGRLKIKIGKFI